MGEGGPDTLSPSRSEYGFDPDQDWQKVGHDLDPISL